ASRCWRPLSSAALARRRCTGLWRPAGSLTCGSAGPAAYPRGSSSAFWLSSWCPGGLHRGGIPVIHHLTGTERVWLAWYGRLRISRYVGTVGDMYRTVTGREHPRARDRR